MRANVCPKCGSTVSQFAAGCAICGADLESYRRRQRRSRTAVSVPTPAPLRLGSEMLHRLAITGLLLLLALNAPLYGVIFSGLVAADRTRRGDRVMSALALACLTLGLLGLFVGFWPLGRFGPGSS